MKENDNRQDATIAALDSLLRPDEGVLALALSGSCARPGAARDFWSDVDALVVVEERALARFFPSVEWLRPLGALFAYEQNSGGLAHTTRVCFEDFRRLDLVFTTEGGLSQIDSWGWVSFWAGTRTLFSRSPVVDKVLADRFERPAPPHFSPEQLDATANRFRFKASVALTKAARGDLLIALHLSLDLARDCCVLGMLLRDRAEGTTHHRTGGAWNELAARVSAPRAPVDAAAVLDSVEQSAALFDELAARLFEGYEPRRAPLLSAIARARRDARG